MNKKYKIGFVIGRFQPFHNGHVYLLKKSLENCEKIIIGIGSTNIKNDDNPYSFISRKSMLLEFLREENLEDRILKIVPLPDVPDDNEWYEKTVKKTGKIDVVIGNNEWVNGIFEGKGYSVLRVKYYKRMILEGVKIRGRMREKKEWESRVPKYLVESIRKHQ